MRNTARILAGALFCLSMNTSTALATNFNVNWLLSVQCGSGATCSCREVSGYVVGTEALKKTIAPLNRNSWSSMTLVSSIPMPLAMCSMVLTATDCSYYACKSTSPTTSQCGTWTDSKTVTVPCNNGKTWVEYYTNTGFRLNFAAD